MAPLPNPWSIADIKPEILVFRRNRKNVTIGFDMNAENAVNLMVNNDLLATSRIVFTTHGFKSDDQTDWLHRMKDKMIDKSDQTVAIVGWGKGSKILAWKYEQAASNCLVVGKWLSSYLKEIRKRFKNINIWGVGHSLGAHLMGMAGKESRVMDRITALDPAGVGFQDKNLDKRLSKTDAKLVDVIHSDGKSVPYFGTLVPLGTIDFYPNFGWHQPKYDSPKAKPYSISEDNDSEPKVTKRNNTKRKVTRQKNAKSKITKQKNAEPDVSEIDQSMLGCLWDCTISHSRAVEYFIWSIDNKEKFRTRLVLEGRPDVGKPIHRLKSVDIETEMGYFADQHPIKEGQECCYFVNTNAKEPWL